MLFSQVDVVVPNNSIKVIYSLANILTLGVINSMLYYCAKQHLQVHNIAFLFGKGLRPQVLYSKVGGIVPGRLSKLIIMSFLFLLNKSFSSKYHLFDSVLLSRIVSINTEQDLFIN